MGKKIKSIQLLGGKCSKCGAHKPWVLTFHHINPDDKEFNINNKRTCRWSIIEKEIKKCTVVCYNCHKEIHHIDSDTKSQTNKKVCLDFKKIYSCEICGYSKCNESLEFHHKENKDFVIGNYINNITFLKSVKDLSSKLKKELSHCSVLCSNCHHDIHFDKEKFELNREIIYNYEYKEIPKPIDSKTVLQLYKDGMNQTDISRKLKCCKSTINGILKKLFGGIIVKTTPILSSEKKIKEKRHSKTPEEWIKKILDSCKDSEDNCWLWKGKCNQYGYGTISLKKGNEFKDISIHRLIYEKFKGPIPLGLLLAHTCINSNCCNPNHQFLGTPKEIGEFRKKMGRTHRTFGEKSGVHKIKTEQIILIRQDPRKLMDIANSYGVAKSTISGIKNFKSRVYG